MTQPQNYSLANVKDVTSFPDLTQGTHKVAIKGIPEVYLSIGDGGKSFGNTLSVTVRIVQSATLAVGSVYRVRIKGQNHWHDAPIDPSTNQPNYEKSSGYRFLQQYRSLLLVLSGNVGKQLSDQDFATLQNQLLTGGWEGREMIVDTKEKVGRGSKLPYSTNKFSPAQAAA